MEVKDYSNEFDKKPSVGHHSAIFPETIRCIIAGTSGCGKTMLLTNLLREPGILDYEDFYIYCPTIYQDSYKNLKKHFDDQEKCLQLQYRKRTNKTKVFKIGHFIIPIETEKAKKHSKEDPDEAIKEAIKDPKELDPNCNHVMVFDDVMLEDQKIIKKYFTAGRHNNVNIFYLVQSIHAIAKHCIRQNANVFILFDEDEKTLKYFHETHCSKDMDFKEFHTFCQRAWDIDHGFVVINIYNKPKYGKYWCNYTHVYTPVKYLDKI